MMRQPPSSNLKYPLFPDTTLFRSGSRFEWPEGGWSDVCGNRPSQDAKSMRRGQPSVDCRNKCGNDGKILILNNIVTRGLVPRVHARRFIRPVAADRKSTRLNSSH